MRNEVVLIRINNNELDTGVQELLSHAGQPLCTNTIAFLLNRPTRDICMSLTRLQKYHIVNIKKVTARRVQFWEMSRN